MIPSRGAIIAVLVAAMVSYVWWIHYDRNKIQTEFNTYKELINDQIAQNKAEAAATEKRQDEKLKDAQIAYEVDRGKLVTALDRMRKSQAVPGSSPLPVAGGSSGSVPQAPTDTTGFTIALATRTGTCEGSFYEDSLITTQRLKALQEFVR